MKDRSGFVEMRAKRSAKRLTVSDLSRVNNPLKNYGLEERKWFSQKRFAEDLRAASGEEIPNSPCKSK